MPQMVSVTLDLSILRYNLQRILGGSLQVPSSYVVFDLETTGLEPETSKIWAIGMYLVKNGRPLFHRGFSVLVRTSEKDLLANRFEINRLAEQIMETGSETLDQAVARAEEQYLRRFLGSTPPVERELALKEAARLLEDCINQGIPIVGHNLARFDIPFFEHECREVGVVFQFPYSGILDTGMLIKSAEVRRRILDTEYYRPLAFYRRVSEERRKGAIYALDRFCVYYWRLDRKYGVDTTKSHDAGYDCWMTSLVLQELVNTAVGGLEYVHGQAGPERVPGDGRPAG